MLRVVTVSEGSRVLRWQNISRFSIIRLRGKWLRQAGFEPGAKVLVAVEKGRMVITCA